ncbi:WW domain binding protein 1-like isoform X2 [Scleropages formosus]|uniref:Si:ch73-290k24.6 n=2 Tax=Scleropages formosus TaxID=113540 RepID=A0A8C9S6L2_SCLFO|nr:WW domain binding protein 1-like isoform X2 [Scleropages formosus]
MDYKKGMAYCWFDPPLEMMFVSPTPAMDENEEATTVPLIGSPKYCPGDNNKGGYLCESGHCCGEMGCCTYYYELWWFWLLWTVLILFSCCCAYRHRRAKLRIQQQHQRQREINLMAYHGALSHPTSMLDLSFLSSFKLPSYEEVAAQPRTPPPPYSTVFALHGSRHYEHAGPSGITSSQSSDNYTSCSCESCSTVSPSSTSISMQVSDETSNVSTPGETDESRVPSATHATLASPPESSTSTPALTLADLLGALRQQREGEVPPEEPSEDAPSRKPALSPPKRTVFSSNVDFFEPDIVSSVASLSEDEDADESHFRHRRMTGDSGIEVCRCQVESEDEEEEAEPRMSKVTGTEDPGPVHDSADCSNRTQAVQTAKPEECGSPCGSTSVPQDGQDPIIIVESM